MVLPRRHREPVTPFASADEQSLLPCLAQQNPNSVAKISHAVLFFSFLHFYVLLLLTSELLGFLVCQVERGIDLVYGGGSIGLMGLVSHAVHDGGRHVIG